MPQLKKYQKKGDADLLATITEPKEQKRIIQTVKATEGYLMLSCIAMGLLQLIAYHFSNEMCKETFHYKRTPTKGIPSEATVACYIRKNIYRFMLKMPDSCITQYIYDKQEDPSNYKDRKAS